MIAGALAAAAVLALALAVWERAAGREPGRGSSGDRVSVGPAGGTGEVPARIVEALAVALERSGIARRLELAGLAGRLPTSMILCAHLAGGLGGLLAGQLAAPAAPGRFGILVLVGMPAAGFLTPLALAERAARRRLERIVRALPDVLELVAASASAGRSPPHALAEAAAADRGPLARELAVLEADLGAGAAQAEALAELRRRLPCPELSALTLTLERAGRQGMPLADRLREQARGIRADRRRGVQERAARAAPKIQLAVALLLVPSVLLVIAAGLVANADYLLGGI